MKRIIGSTILGLICTLAFQTAPAQSYWVFFSDKGAEASVLETAPESLLSPRALRKRAQRGIPIDERDVPVSPSYLAQLRDAGVEVHRASKCLNAVSVDTDLSYAELQGICPAISGMQPVGTFVRHQIDTPSVPDLPEAPPAAFNYGFAQDQVEMLNVDCLHDRGFTGQDVLVAVFDAGFQDMDTIYAFDSLWANNRVLGIFDFVDQDTTVFSENFHGMSVASCFAGNLPGDFVGTAPRVSLLLARTETVFAEIHQEEDNWMAAVEWADSMGADMIQNSLGYSTFDSGEGDYTYADLDGNTTIITRAADIAAAKGILVVSSAGNEGGSGWHYITAPCDADSILCVGAVTDIATKASFSSVGPTSDGRIKPDVMALGLGTVAIGPSGNVANLSGTSFSAPLVAGMAACLWEAHPLRSNMDVITAIRESGDRFATPDTAYGYGIPDACVADSILSALDSLATQAELFAHPERLFEVFPNPAQDHLVVRPTALALPLKRLEIIAADGSVVLSVPLASNSASEWVLETSALSPGLYLLQLHFFENRSVSHKFVKQ